MHEDNVARTHSLNKTFNGIAMSTKEATAARLSLCDHQVYAMAPSTEQPTYRQRQTNVYNFLERPTGYTALAYHMSVLVMVLFCLLLSVFATIEEYEEQATMTLFYTEMGFMLWLTLEYMLRLWACGCRSRYRHLGGRLRFAASPYCLVDMVVIAASLVVFLAGATGQVFATSAIRGLRFFQILRMLRIDRRAGTWRLLGSVIWAHRQELITTIYIGFLGLIFGSFVMYLVEKDTNPAYDTFADALWWGITTLTTVGYGDKVPETWKGKMVASLCSLMGITFFALPAGILGSGFALKVQEHQRQKHLIRRRVPAARYIQCLWRLYSANHNANGATWRIHLRQQSVRPSQGQGPNIISRIARVGVGSRRRAEYKSSLDGRPSSPSSVDVRYVARRADSDGGMSVESMRRKSKRMSNRQLMRQATETRFRQSCATRKESLLLPGVSAILANTSPRDGLMINELAMAPLWNSQTAHIYRRPRVRQTSIGSEETTRGHKTSGGSNPSNASFRAIASNWIHSPSLPRFSLDLVESPPSPSSSEGQLDIVSPPARPPTTNDEEPTCTLRTMADLTPQWRHSIRAIRIIKLMLARRKFREALRPYDVKDVIEQYSAGHVDLVARVKSIQTRLECLCGKHGTPLAHSVNAIERRVAGMESKLGVFIEMYIQDRRNAQHPQSISPSLAGVSSPYIDSYLMAPTSRRRHSSAHDLQIKS